jgi:hypothetical protein
MIETCRFCGCPKHHSEAIGCTNYKGRRLCGCLAGSWLLPVLFALGIAALVVVAVLAW